MTTPEPGSTPEAVTVCGGKLTSPEQYPSTVYRGQRLYFCLRACLRAFESDPERFLAGEIEHPIEEEL